MSSLKMSYCYLAFRTNVLLNLCCPGHLSYYSPNESEPLSATRFLIHSQVSRSCYKYRIFWQQDKQRVLNGFASTCSRFESANQKRGSKCETPYTNPGSATSHPHLHSLVYPTSSISFTSMWHHCYAVLQTLIPMCKACKGWMLTDMSVCVASQSVVQRVDCTPSIPVHTTLDLKNPMMLLPWWCLDLRASWIIVQESCANRQPPSLVPNHHDLVARHDQDD